MRPSGARELAARDPIAGGAGPSEGPVDKSASRERELASREPIAGAAGPSEGPVDKSASGERGLASREPIAGGAGPLYLTGAWLASARTPPVPPRYARQSRATLAPSEGPAYK